MTMAGRRRSPWLSRSAMMAMVRLRSLWICGGAAAGATCGNGRRLRRFLRYQATGTMSGSGGQKGGGGRGCGGVCVECKYGVHTIVLRSKKNCHAVIRLICKRKKPKKETKKLRWIAHQMDIGSMLAFLLSRSNFKSETSFGFPRPKCTGQITCFFL